MSLRDALNVAQDTSPIGAFLITDVDTVGGFYGYVSMQGAWIIKSFDGSSMRYVAGAGGYASNWTNRASLTYTTPDLMS